MSIIRLDRKKKDDPICLWTRRCWRVYHLKKYNSWHLLRHWHLVTGCEKTFWASKHCPVEVSSRSYVTKLTSNIVWQPGRSAKLDVTGTTVEDHYSSVQGIHIFPIFSWIPSRGTDSWRNNDWANSWSSNRENSWRIYDRNFDYINCQTCKDILRCDVQRNRAFCERNSWPQRRAQVQ